MKKIIFAALLFISLGIQAQITKLDKLFDQYQDTDGITSIKIAKPMFKLLNNLDIQDSDLDKIKPLISKINSIKILIIDPQKNKVDDKNKATLLDADKLKEEIYGAVKKLNYEELMTVNSKGNKIKFLAENTNSDILNNLLLSINGDSQNILMLLDGKISMDDVSKLVNEADKKDKK